MFSKVALLATASLVLSVAAGGVSQCDTGAVQCCQSIHQSQSKAGSGLLALVGAVVQGVNTDVGFNCSPITASVVGAAAGSGADWYVLYLLVSWMCELVLMKFSLVPPNLFAAMATTSVSSWILVFFGFSDFFWYFILLIYILTCRWSYHCWLLARQSLKGSLACLPCLFKAYDS
jgi:hypothetical protein